MIRQRYPAARRVRYWFWLRVMHASGWTELRLTDGGLFQRAVGAAYFHAIDRANACGPTLTTVERQRLLARLLSTTDYFD